MTYGGYSQKLWLMNFVLKEVPTNLERLQLLLYFVQELQHGRH
jgi:hypothetical protein